VAEAAMSKFLAAVQQRVQYVELMKSCGAPEGSLKHAANLHGLVEGMMKLARAAKVISTSEAMETKCELERALDEAALQTVMNAVNAKVDIANISPNSGREGADKLNFLNIDDFMTDQLWDIFANMGYNATDKLILMANALRGLGVEHGTERTYAFAAALATNAHGLDVTALLADTRKLKGFCRTSTLDHISIYNVTRYPPTPDDLQQEFPEIYSAFYADHPPARSRWTASYRSILIGMLPCRSTKSGVDQSQLGPSSASGSMRSGINAASRVAFQQLQSGPPQRMSDVKKSCGLKPQNTNTPNKQKTRTTRSERDPTR
jgi:hypothetical protein